MKKFSAFLGLASLYLFSLPGHAEEQKPHVALVVGTLHYSPELSMPLFSKDRLSDRQLLNVVAYVYQL